MFSFYFSLCLIFPYKFLLSRCFSSMLSLFVQDFPHSSFLWFTITSNVSLVLTLTNATFKFLLFLTVSLTALFNNFSFGDNLQHFYSFSLSQGILDSLLFHLFAFSPQQTLTFYDCTISHILGLML